jgi:hypothetical protein
MADVVLGKQSLAVPSEHWVLQIVPSRAVERMLEGTLHSCVSSVCGLMDVIQVFC